MPQTRLMQALARYIEAHAEEALSLETLAHQAQLSPAHLQRSFRAAFGISPKAYHDAARVRRLKASLQSGDKVLDAITTAGFQSTSRVYEMANRRLGMTPTAYRSGGAGEVLFHACRETRLGPLLMAASSHGVCFAQFGDSRQMLVEALRREFPRASLQPSTQADSPELDAWIAALDEHLAGHAPRPELPLDLRGTAFQIQVWRFLLRVPAGQPITYGKLAAGIGAPGAVRAAASACAANRIAVLIPCHRVLRADGGLGGYRWGLERKRKLLEREGATAR